MITIEDMVQREIQCCVSGLVSTLAGGYGHAIGCDSRGNGRLKDLEELCGQAGELASSVLDYEEAATQAGWVFNKSSNDYMHMVGSSCNAVDANKTWRELCEFHGIDPYEWEVYEHWAVSTWLAEKLQAQGERVDTDFAGLNVWARTTTGQAISMDACMQRIYADMMQPGSIGASA